MAILERVTYTTEELEAAKSFLRDRLRNERSMSADVERTLTSYATLLLAALFDNLPDSEIERIIADMVESLIFDCRLLALDDHDKSDDVLLFMLGERHGDTLRGRIDKRCHTFLNEVAAVYLAGRLLGKTEDYLLRTIKGSFKHPWQNEVLVSVREKIAKGEVSGNIEDFAEPHFGQGTEISSLGALDTILTYAVADAWVYWQWLDARERGAKGYYVVRGSSYPCDECDSHTGIFYPIDDELSKPQYHAHCCCMVVYSYVDRL